MPSTGPSQAERLAAYGAVSTRLALISDRRLAEMTATATPLGSGIGGRSAELRLGGTPVFVKRVPVTELELRPEHARSTANLFGLPTYYQYGMGSAGFGAWRELAAHVMTTNWVLGGEYDGFPLMYHWRILPDRPPEGFVDEFGSIDAAVAHWEGSSAVRRRLEAIGRSAFSLVLFLEHVPTTLADCLGGRSQTGVSKEVEGFQPHAWVEEALILGTDFMSSRGFVHFDAHFANILTDGHRLYFADLGLALSSDFALSPEEQAFLTHHRAYDHCSTMGHLLRRHLLDGICGEKPYRAVLHDWIAGHRPGGLSPAAAAIVDRHASAALVLADWHHQLLTESKQSPFPAARLP
ncbi:hypothetical protein GCM10009716_24550 [Streptomyces sodiiphilus]|uniref:Protein kinase domain-containing protein n=1 Tax=Streptomyces sodiiphilus TaxID=226217 RepID=A0ABP5AK79_9ACTN